MPTDKETKAWFKKEAAKDYKKYYPTTKLEELGFIRKICTETKTPFWTLNKEQTVCGEPEVNGGYSFIGDSPAKKPISYLDVWPRFKAFFENKGYKVLDRRPVVARWRNDVYWVAASVYPFQPYVVRGEIKPPSNAVIIPQLSLRFNDVDNVGITGSHYTCFDMLGQLHFEPKESYDTDTYFAEYLEWITSEEGMGIPATELTLHEDVWAGGGTFGTSIEFFSRGMEIGNQVYMQFEIDDRGEKKELDIKVLDMGQGHERVPWLTSGTSTSYDTTFPTVMKYLYEVTGFTKDDSVVQQFLPYAALLNADEVDDIEAQWNFIATEMNIDVKKLRECIEPLAALYSIAEHMRAALVGIGDGALPSNVGGGYNMRIIIRRAFSFLEKYGWNVDLHHVVREHAAFLAPLYPELQEHVELVTTVLDKELEKYKESVAKSEKVLDNFWKNSAEKKEYLNPKIVTKKMLELYDSHGIPFEKIIDGSKKYDFEGFTFTDTSKLYALLSERHEKQEQKTATNKNRGVHGKQKTEILYFDNYELVSFEATVISSGPLEDDEEGSDVGYVELDKTAFYPTSGGQVHDTGILNGFHVIDVFKSGDSVMHVVENYHAFFEGSFVQGTVDRDRRVQLSQHHSAAHIVGAAARKVLGNHINQAGASKDITKARLDITHYENISDEVLLEIEKEANSMIAANLPITQKMYLREDAEEAFGTRIYQGGFVPGKEIRIVAVADDDVQACGGTHVNTTSEVETIKLLSTSKVQDGIIRLHFVAGEKAKQESTNEESFIEEAATLLECTQYQIPDRADELFAMWKAVKKAKKKGQPITEEMVTLSSTQHFDGNVLAETAKRLKTQPEHVVKTLKRFKDDIRASQG